MNAKRQRHKDEAAAPLFAYSYSRPGTRPQTPLASGYQTPRELREEKWKQEESEVNTVSKTEMREIYKEMGGRKAKKSKTGMVGGVRDRTAWGDEAGWA